MTRTPMEMAAYRMAERNIGLPDWSVHKCDSLWCKRGFGSKVRKAKKKLRREHKARVVLHRRMARYGATVYD